MEATELLKIIQDEGNEMDFEVLGFPARIRRMGANGHWCGYIQVQKDSRLYGKNYYTSSESELGISKVKEAINNIEIHGGLTFAGKFDDDNWWFGFDCAHSGDLQFYQFDYKMNIEGDIYRTKEYVIDECKKLALQIKEIIDLKL